VGLAEASVQIAEAALKDAQTSLRRSKVTAPIDGVVIDRRANIGSSVVPGTSVFLIAQDLREMEIWANVNEADIADIQVGPRVRFAVAAIPDEEFVGTVKLTRLSARVIQNIVVYTVVVSTENVSGKLLPYMTADLRFEVSRRDNVLKVPNGAIRWSPRADEVAAAWREKAAAYIEDEDASAQVKSSAPAPGNERVLWESDGEFVRPHFVRIGLSDGVSTVVEGDGLQPNLEIVVGRPPSQRKANRFLSQFNKKDDEEE
jgi:HlyD family secretion protein